MKSSKEHLRAAVVGVGYLGRFHAQKYAALEGVDLVGVVDTDLEAARASSRETGSEAFSSHRDLLGKVDAVSVAVPTPLHFEVARDFLNAGADVLIEKPVTTTLAEADELLELAEKHGRIIQVGHLERFNPAMLALAGKIPDPVFMEAQRLSSFKPRALNISVVLDLMIHDLDLILGLAASPLTDIRATGASVLSPHLDMANARLSFENGCVASVTASRMCQKDMRKIRVFGKDRYASVDFANRHLYLMRPGDDRTSGIPGMEIEEKSFETADALAAEIRAFCDSVRNRVRPLVSGEEGRQALATALTVSEIILKQHGR